MTLFDILTFLKTCGFLCRYLPYKSFILRQNSKCKKRRYRKSCVPNFADIHIQNDNRALENSRKCRLPGTGRHPGHTEDYMRELLFLDLVVEKRASKYCFEVFKLITARVLLLCGYCHINSFKTRKGTCIELLFLKKSLPGVKICISKLLRVQLDKDI